MLDVPFLTPADLAGLLFFLGVWAAFSFISSSSRWIKRPTLTVAVNRQREAWMRTMVKRDMRMVDTGIMAGLQQGTAFFASTCVFAIGGCFALLGAADQVMMVLGDLRFATVPSRAVFEAKVLGLLMIFAYSFFKFGWSYRLSNYCFILIGAVPVLREAATSEQETETAILRAVRMNVLAGKHFNAGMRAVFFSIGYLGWFIGPWVLVATSIFVLSVLVRRQFFSAAREAALG